jgi:hypothetical protein
MTQPPKCRKCGSDQITATSSQQQLKVDGVKRLHAEAVCGNCSHTWWSVHPTIKRLAREADKARKSA